MLVTTLELYNASDLYDVGFPPIADIGRPCDQEAMRQRPKKRRKMQSPAKQEGLNSYLRRITPFALLCFPFWLALPFIVDADRIALFLSGTVPPWKLLLWLFFVLLMSFVGSAYSDWDDRRKAAKAKRR